jgi:hypothetical protein
VCVSGDVFARMEENKELRKVVVPVLEGQFNKDKCGYHRHVEKEHPKCFHDG